MLGAEHARRAQLRPACGGAAGGGGGGGAAGGGRLALDARCGGKRGHGEMAGEAPDDWMG